MHPRSKQSGNRGSIAISKGYQGEVASREMGPVAAGLIGVINGDTRSVDYSPHEVNFVDTWILSAWLETFVRARVSPMIGRPFEDV